MILFKWNHWFYLIDFAVVETFETSSFMHSLQTSTTKVETNPVPLLLSHNHFANILLTKWPWIWLRSDITSSQVGPTGRLVKNIPFSLSKKQSSFFEISNTALYRWYIRCTSIVFSSWILRWMSGRYLH